MFRKILIANRGEIAVRVIRACRDLGVQSVAVYSEADKDALHVKLADEAYPVGPPPPSQSYLNIDRILEVAQKTSVEAIHPGYGFLSQIPAFAERCERVGAKFIGPRSETMRRMGDKLHARRVAGGAGVQVIPGTEGVVKDLGDVERAAEKIGYPFFIKAVFGGGGKGIRLVRDREEAERAMEIVALEAEASFGHPELYVEKRIEDPRHIEFQVLADEHGTLLNLYERECSIQRRHQKLLEEAPSPVVNSKLRVVMEEAALKVARVVDYTNAGTVEFLLGGDGRFYFLEMNTRLQVEHLITELVTGVDLVKEQIRIAAGEELKISQEEVELRGWAINCRINAENPARDFTPTPGTITNYVPPGGPGVRVDSALYSGYGIPVFYDSLIAKLAVWGRTRSEAIARMRRALNEFIVEGVTTTIPFHKTLIQNEAYVRGEFHVNFVDRHIGELVQMGGFEDYREVAAISTVLAELLAKPYDSIPLRGGVKRGGFRDQGLLWSRTLREGHYVEGV